MKILWSIAPGNIGVPLKARRCQPQRPLPQSPIPDMVVLIHMAVQNERITGLLQQQFDTLLKPQLRTRMAGLKPQLRTRMAGLKPQLLIPMAGLKPQLRIPMAGLQTLQWMLMAGLLIL
jgi:hypothetical protein